MSLTGQAGDGALRPLRLRRPRMYESCGRVDGKREQPMDYSREPIASELRHRGYEYELSDGFYVFRKVIDQDDISRALEDCFGEKRKEVAVPESALPLSNFEKLIAWLERMNWE